MAEVIDRRYLLLQKYLKLRNKHGHDHAMAQFGQPEKDDMFNYIVSCSTPQNHDLVTDSFRITPTV